MKAELERRDGLELCIEAFQRLVEGAPILAAHVGLHKSKITAGVVSVEAGFDRGYLKKARAVHQPLIAQIEAFRNSSVIREAASTGQKIKVIENKYKQLSEELDIVKSQRDLVLAQNIQLFERVKELEGLLLKASVRAI